MTPHRAPRRVVSRRPVRLASLAEVDSDIMLLDGLLLLR
jgi:hypothetical protein